MTRGRSAKGDAIRSRLLHLVTTEPNKYTQAQLACEVGVTREWVRQLVNELGIRHLLGKRQHAVCIECGKQIAFKGRRCKDCWLKKDGAKRVSLVCETCGITFERKESEAKRHKHHFHNQVCYGRYAGKHYGFTAHPENRFGVRRRIKMEELEITTVKKLLIPGKHVRGYYLSLIERCAQLPDDEALKIKCPSIKVAVSVIGVMKRRGFRAIRRTQEDGIYAYISKLL